MPTADFGHLLGVSELCLALAQLSGAGLDLGLQRAVQLAVTVLALLQFLLRFHQVGDVEPMIHVAHEVPTAVMAGSAVVPNPAVHAIMAAQTVVQGVGFQACQAFVDQGLAAFPIFRVEPRQPTGMAIAERLLAGEVQPALVGVTPVPVGFGGPDECPAAVREAAEIVFALAQRQLLALVYQY